jgi:hypothetical protein
LRVLKLHLKHGAGKPQGFGVASICDQIASLRLHRSSMWFDLVMLRRTDDAMSQ